MHPESRKIGHNLPALAAVAVKFMPEEQALYDAIISRLAGNSMHLRYSLDAFEVYMAVASDDPDVRVSRHVFEDGPESDHWRLQGADEVQTLILSAPITLSPSVMWTEDFTRFTEDARLLSNAKASKGAP
jgi:hypothetical protein